MFYKVHTSNKNSDYSAVISKLIETCDTISFPCDVSVFTKCFFSRDADFCIMPRLSFQADIQFPWVVWLLTFPLPCLILSHQRQEFLTLLPGNEPNMTYLYMYVKQRLGYVEHTWFCHYLFIVGRSWEWWFFLLTDGCSLFMTQLHVPGLTVRLQRSGSHEAIKHTQSFGNTFTPQLVTSGNFT